MRLAKLGSRACFAWQVSLLCLCTALLASDASKHHGAADAPTLATAASSIVGCR
jgi:hypothetical protein